MAIFRLKLSKFIKMFQVRKLKGWMLIILIIAPIYSFGNTVDSLKCLLGDENDTSNYKVYIALGEEYEKINYDSAIYYKQLGLKQATDQNNKFYIGKFHNHLAIYYAQKGWLKIALKHQKSSLDIRKAEGEPNKVLIALNNYGMMLVYAGLYEEASEALYEAIALEDLLDDTPVLTFAYSNLGYLYYLLEDHQKAKYFYHKVLQWPYDKKSAKGMTLRRLGFIYKNEGKLDSALYFYKSSLKLSKENNSIIDQINDYENLSGVYLSLDNFERSYEYILKAKVLNAKTLNSLLHKSTVEKCFGEYYFHKKEFANSLTHYHSSLNLCSLLGNIPSVKDLYGKLYNAHKANSNYDSALYYHELYTSLNDSLFNVEKSNQIAELETIYQTEKKEKEILQLEKDKEKKQSQLLYLSSLVVLLLLLIVFTYFYYKSRQKSIVLHTKSREQKKQFGAILMAQEEERKRIAAELHDSVGPLLSVSQLYISEVLDIHKDEESESLKLNQKSLNAIDEACREVRNISHNLMPGVLVQLGLVPACRELIRKIRDTKVFEISFESSGYEKRLDESIEVSFYRILQELLNNTIKHSKAEKVTVSLIQENNELVLSVADNGIGFDPNSNNHTQGIGMQNVKTRLALINGVIHIDNIKKGTNIIVKAPLFKNDVLI